MGSYNFYNLYFLLSVRYLFLAAGILIFSLIQIKHFDDPALSALRQLDDISQVFDPSQKAHFLGQTLCAALPVIPEVSRFPH